MSARRFLNAVHLMLVEANGAEKVEEMLAPDDDPRLDLFSVVAMGGEVA